jgi:hypothetical protein
MVRGLLEKRGYIVGRTNLWRTNIRIVLFGEATLE